MSCHLCSFLLHLAPPLTAHLSAHLSAHRSAHRSAHLSPHLFSLFLDRSGGDDIKDPNQIRVLLKDIEENRRAKLQRGLRQLDESKRVTLNHVSAIEINGIREISVRAMDRMLKLVPPKSEYGDASEPSGSAANGARMADALRRRLT